MQKTDPQTRIRRYQKKSYSPKIPEIYQIKQFQSSELSNNDQNTSDKTKASILKPKKGIIHISEILDALYLSCGEVKE